MNNSFKNTIAAVAIILFCANANAASLTMSASANSVVDAALNSKFENNLWSGKFGIYMILESSELGVQALEIQVPATLNQSNTEAARSLRNSIQNCFTIAYSRLQRLNRGLTIPSTVVTIDGYTSSTASVITLPDGSTGPTKTTVVVNRYSRVTCR